MGQIIRISAALLLLSVCRTSPVPAAGAPRPIPAASEAGAVIRLAQAKTEDQKRRLQDEEFGLRNRERAKRREREMEERERARQHERERSIRLEQETRKLRERQVKERELRERRLRKGYETTEERRRRARRERRLNAVPRELSKRFPPAWVAGIMEGRVETGWNAEAVRTSWGPPEKITRDAGGLEIWHYAAGDVYFSNGVVSAVVDAKPAQKPSGTRRKAP